MGFQAFFGFILRCSIPWVPVQEHIHINFFVYFWGPLGTLKYKINIIFYSEQKPSTAESICSGNHEIYLPSKQIGEHSIFIVSLV